MVLYDRDAKIHPAHVYEGDRVLMRMSSHNLDKYGGALLGTVTEAPRESDRPFIEDGDRLMVDYSVEADDGTKWTWMMDNGYVKGPVDDPDRPSVSDIGRFRAFYDPDEIDLDRLREIDALVE